MTDFCMFGSHLFQRATILQEGPTRAFPYHQSPTFEYMAARTVFFTEYRSKFSVFALSWRLLNDVIVFCWTTLRVFPFAHESSTLFIASYTHRNIPSGCFYGYRNRWTRGLMTGIQSKCRLGLLLLMVGISGRIQFYSVEHSETDSTDVPLSTAAITTDNVYYVSQPRMSVIASHWQTIILRWTLCGMSRKTYSRRVLTNEKAVSDLISIK